ncbi:thiamine pyrophosphate-dependent enzyme [Thermoactinospora rubra]|uniref:thiamine pyrophosphate-dependent enzyme n=1 Tax=Thermoactinospora rubra TaxID=1088767 RepID=UPI000A118A63|nr:thiamine pyrophosphate-dependent enzyme [Thermoactinospora rubra]
MFATVVRPPLPCFAWSDFSPFVGCAESFGARGYRVGSAEELLPTLREALAYDGVSVVVVPVDYSHNLELTPRQA